MNVAELKKYLQERGVLVSGYLKLCWWKSPRQLKEWFCQWIQTSKKIKPMMQTI